MTPGFLHAPLTREAVERALAAKTKPPGSLGRLELLATDVALYLGTLGPEVDAARLCVFAGDHGVTAEGVSAYPSEVTVQMMANFASGGAAACVMAKALGVDLEVIDVGVAAGPATLSGIRAARVAPGTANFLRGPAMSASQCDQALEEGRAAARRAWREGYRTLALGEMGIGNSTAAAAMVSLLAAAAAEDTCGPGTGLDSRGVAHKQRVVREAVAIHAETSGDARAVLGAVGGLEIAAMTGAALEASRLGVLVVIDGFIATAAALAAAGIDRSARAAMIFAHRSAEPGHRIALDALRASPLLDLGLRLGEGTGALLAVPIIRAAAAMLRMATFDSAHVSGPIGA